LTTDTSVLTAGGNDLGFENVFSRQVEALGQEGDLLIVITTSGNSPNLVQAAEMAHSRGMKVLGVLGGNGGKLKQHCDKSIVVPFEKPGEVQEMHLIIGHLLCDLSERSVYDD
jgi:D-sedoheptulose 7-phosphate isomerase